MRPPITQQPYDKASVRNSFVPVLSHNTQKPIKMAAPNPPLTNRRNPSSKSTVLTFPLWP